MAYYPKEYRRFTTKRNFTQVIYASHVNDLQEELYATQVILGVNPHIAPRDPGFRVPGWEPRNYGTVGDRLQAYLRGEQLPYYEGAIVNYPLTPGNTAVPPPNNPEPPQNGGGGCARNDRGLQWLVPVHSRSHMHTPVRDYLRRVGGILTPIPGLDDDHTARYRRITTGRWSLTEDPVRGPRWEWWAGEEWIDEDHFLGLPLVHDEQTTDDGRWWRLPIHPTSDPFMMKSGDGLVLCETGLWMVSLRVDGVPTSETRAARARRRARLEINGQDVGLRHLVRENQHNGDFLHNYIHWVEVLPAGTTISASARVDGEGLTAPVPVTAYLRAHLIRCVDHLSPGGELVDAPAPRYNPPPPSPQDRQPPPRRDPDYDDCSFVWRGDMTITIFVSEGGIVTGIYPYWAAPRDPGVMMHVIPVG